MPRLVRLKLGLLAFAGRVWRVTKVAGLVSGAAGLVLAVFLGAQKGYAHVLTSPHFSLSTVSISTGPRLNRIDILNLSGVTIGDPLLQIDADAVAARIARHPWTATVRVQRQLPSSLVIDVSERKAAAVVALGALYLIDEAGRPFKRATMEEADGLVVLTGIDRATYVDAQGAAEGAFREALTVLGSWRTRGAFDRPEAGEMHIHSRYGFTLFFFEGGAEIRLGRGRYDEKLAQLDRILEAVSVGGRGGLGRLRLVHLDGGLGGLVPVSMDPDPIEEAAAAAAADTERARLKTVAKERFLKEQARANARAAKAAGGVSPSQAGAPDNLLVNTHQPQPID